MADQQELTDGEILSQKYKNLLNEMQDVTQCNITLLQDKNDLNQSNTALQKRVEELINELNQSTKTIEELTKSNNAFKIVLQVIEDEWNFNKSANFEKFNKFIENYIVNLFDNFNFNNLIINKIFEFMQRFNILNNRYTHIIYTKFLKPVFVILYAHLIDFGKICIT